MPLLSLRHKSRKTKTSMSSEKMVGLTHCSPMHVDWSLAMKSGMKELDDETYWVKDWDKTEATEADIAQVRKAVEKAQAMKQNK